MLNGVIENPFPGEGLYLWEENTDQANRQGIKHYENRYNIVEYVDVEIKYEELLNLTD